MWIYIYIYILCVYCTSTFLTDHLTRRRNKFTGPESCLIVFWKKIVKQHILPDMGSPSKKIPRTMQICRFCGCPITLLVLFCLSVCVFERVCDARWFGGWVRFYFVGLISAHVPVLLDSFHQPPHLEDCASWLWKQYHEGYQYSKRRLGQRGKHWSSLLIFISRCWLFLLACVRQPATAAKGIGDGLLCIYDLNIKLCFFGQQSCKKDSTCKLCYSEIHLQWSLYTHIRGTYLLELWRSLVAASSYNCANTYVEK